MSQPQSLGGLLRHAFRVAPQAAKTPAKKPPRDAGSPTPVRPLATDLAQELAGSVQDETLRGIIERSAQRFFASKRRLLSQGSPSPEGTATLCWPDIKPPRARDPHDGPRVKIFPLDDRRVDAIFVTMELCRVSWLAKLHPSQVLRKGYTRGVCRKAVALMLAKWPGQIKKSDEAFFLKVCDELTRTKGDPRGHPSYRVVRPCEYAMAFAGVAKESEWSI